MLTSILHSPSLPFLLGDTARTTRKNSGGGKVFLLTRCPTLVSNMGASRTMGVPSRRLLYVCRDSLESENAVTGVEDGSEKKRRGRISVSDWYTSVLLFGLWAGLMYYVFRLAPNQTPYMDSYLLQKLLNLKGNDGFHMNEVLVSLWYIMGIWPLIYSMLLFPTGRSSESRILLWPFLLLSFFGGAYVLIPYFVLWKPPPPAIEEDEITKWPLNFLESKLTAGATLAAGLGLIIYANMANGDTWKEFYQYFGGSKFIHVTSLDFTLLSSLAPFWVYNDMTARRWTKKGFWLLPLSFIPVVGPALYLLFRPPLSALSVRLPEMTEK